MPPKTMTSTGSTTQPAPYRRCADNVVVMLQKIFSLGLKAAPRDDLEDLLLALRILRPGLPSIDFSEVHMRIRQMDWAGALHVLKAMEASDSASTVCLALLGCCLYKLGDDEWRRYIALVLKERNNTAAVAMVAKFLQMADQPGIDNHALPVPDQLRTQIADILRSARAPID